MVFTSIGILLPAQQTLDILSISGRYGLPQYYKETYQGNAKEAGAFLGLTVPIQLSENTIIVNNLNYFYFNVQGDPEIPDDIANPININGFILRTGLLQRFSNGRSMQILFAPRIMTDFKNVDANSIHQRRDHPGSPAGVQYSDSRIDLLHRFQNRPTPPVPE